MKYYQRLFKAHSFFSVFFVIGVYRVMLDWLYFNVVVPYNNATYKYFDNRSVETFFISCFLIVISFPFIAKVITTQRDRCSNLIITLLYFISFIPFTTCVYAGMFAEGFVIYNFIYWFILLGMQQLLIQCRVKKFPTMSLGNFKINENFVKLFGFFSIACVVYVSAVYTQFRLHFNIFDVYGIRLEAREYQYPFIIQEWLLVARIVNSLLCGYYILKNKKMMALLFFSAQVLCFGIAANKSEIFMLFLAVLIVFVCRKMTFEQIKYFSILGIIGLSAFAIFETIFLQSNIITILLIRRMMFIPNTLHKCFYDFFIIQGHEPEYFRVGILHFFLKFLGVSESPYRPQGIYFLIGEIYFSRPDMQCNNGLVTDAIMNLGLIGALIAPILLSLILHVLDRAVAGVTQCLVMICVVYWGMTILSTRIISTQNFELFILLFIFAIMTRSPRTPCLRE